MPYVVTYPSTSVVPLISYAGDEMPKFIGTGFFVGDGSVVVTAKHVIQPEGKPLAKYIAIAWIEPDGTVLRIPFKTWSVANKHDIAFLHGANAPGAMPLRLLNGVLSLDEDLVAFEYSSTRYVRQEDGSRRAILMPLFHKGNAMVHYISTAPGLEGTPVFDTSFPALKGASGAPVLHRISRDYGEFVVVGMLVANHARHLMPAEVEHVQLDNEDFSDVKYYLPLGTAIQAPLIVQYLRYEGVDVGVIEK